MAPNEEYLFPRPKYEIITADPPWRFETYSARGKGRSPEAHYPTMSIEEICDLPVRQVASDRAVLFLWVTWPTIFSYAPRVMEAWGFEYRSRAFTWAKTTSRAWDHLHKMLRSVAQGRASVESALEFLRERAWHMGNGYYTRANDEVCLLCVRQGAQNPVSDHGVRSLIVGPVGRHSEKPDEFYRRVQRLYPPRPGRRYLELFARRPRPGWVTLGNEVDGLDIRESLRRAIEEDGGWDRERTKPMSVVVSRNAMWPL